MLTRARDWRFFNSSVRTTLADYGPALMVVVWTGVSYIPENLPSGTPRRVEALGLFNSSNNSNWSIVGSIKDVPAEHWGTGMIYQLSDCKITFLNYIDNIPFLHVEYDLNSIGSSSNYHSALLLRSQCLWPACVLQ